MSKFRRGQIYQDPDGYRLTVTSVDDGYVNVRSEKPRAQTASEPSSNCLSESDQSVQDLALLEDAQQETQDQFGLLTSLISYQTERIQQLQEQLDSLFAVVTRINEYVSR